MARFKVTLQFINEPTVAQAGEVSMTDSQELKADTDQTGSRVKSLSNRDGQAGEAAIGAEPVASRAIGAHPVGTRAVGALAVGAIALGALAVGALAIGRLAVHRMKVGRAQITSLKIADLEVGTLRVRALTVLDATDSTDSKV